MQKITYSDDEKFEYLVKRILSVKNEIKPLNQSMQELLCAVDAINCNVQEVEQAIRDQGTSLNVDAQRQKNDVLFFRKIAEVSGREAEEMLKENEYDFFRTFMNNGFHQDGEKVRIAHMYLQYRSSIA